MQGGGPEVVLRGSGCRLGCREQPMQPVELRIVFALCVCIVANVRACFSGSARMLCCVTHAHARNSLRVERECVLEGAGAGELVPAPEIWGIALFLRKREKKPGRCSSLVLGLETQIEPQYLELRA